MREFKVEETSGGFKYLAVTREDCLKWGGFGVCDLCNDVFAIGYLVPVLNNCVCGKCFNRYLYGDIKIDPEDKAFQDECADGFFKYHVDKIKAFDSVKEED